MAKQEIEQIKNKYWECDSVQKDVFALISEIEYLQQSLSETIKTRDDYGATVMALDSLWPNSIEAQGCEEDNYERSVKWSVHSKKYGSMFGNNLFAIGDMVRNADAKSEPN
jgi:hypothetical protein